MTSFAQGTPRAPRWRWRRFRKTSPLRRGSLPRRCSRRWPSCSTCRARPSGRSQNSTPTQCEFLSCRLDFKTSVPNILASCWGRWWPSCRTCRSRPSGHLQNHQYRRGASHLSAASRALRVNKQKKKNKLEKKRFVYWDSAVLQSRRRPPGTAAAHVPLFVVAILRPVLLFVIFMLF